MSDDLTENYKRAFGRRVGFGARPALILIDLVRAYYDPECDLYMGSSASLESALRVREAASAAGVPVILTNVVYHPSAIDGGRFFEKSKPLRYFLQGEPMGDWAKGLEPRSEELVISKQYPSAFFGTSLASTLTALGIDSVLLTGVSTSGCVRATCVDAMSHGFRTAVIADACGDRHPGPHRANLFDMEAKYADVVNETEVVEFLSTLGPRT
ncbi:isochorismatase family protein [Altererythrobacter sp. C41]|uniref:isochorismatase family protein n=1 Tax=Altererythrobacter sp. C41 TaxID=2806021 RepID=UPI001931FA26|nr:isochorismatase family protein [Altererythrobacter sp. C41]MBM0171096.1 isochorismatase family protein [Altererythrobacter sp. C41]